VQLEHEAMFSGTIAFLAGIGAIAFLLNWLKRHGMLPFVVYRVILGVVLIVWAAYH
jgi:undecaprenyl-diphosphatase